MTKATAARVFSDDTMNAKWYCPPVEGYAELSSASPAAIGHCQIAFQNTHWQVALSQGDLTDDGASDRGNDQAPEHIWPTAGQQRVGERC